MLLLVFKNSEGLATPCLTEPLESHPPTSALRSVTIWTFLGPGSRAEAVGHFNPGALQQQTNKSLVITLFLQFFYFVIFLYLMILNTSLFSKMRKWFNL